MTIADILYAFVRRWYITVPGVLLAISLSITAWVVVPKEYERSASVLLLPGIGSLPGPTANPYLYLGGMAASADVLVGAAGAESNLREIIDQYPTADIAVERDSTVAGPVIRLTATATSDDDAASIVDLLIQTTARTLEDIQQQQSILEENRISMTTLSVDDKGTTQQRTRIVATVAAGAVTLLLALVVAALVDGIARRRRRTPVNGRESSLSGPSDPLDEDDVSSSGSYGSVPDREPEASPASPGPSFDELVELGRSSSDTNASDDDGSDEPRDRKRARR